ncbi:Fc.00g084090.m01.CDS01 [Cosmosporella sp. VM-42]
MARSVSTTDEYEFVDHDDTALSPEALTQISEWLQPTDYLAESGEFRRHLSSQAPGTGLWICETDEYRKWHDSADHGSLWIKGVPGAGKSVMAASIIQHLRATEDCPVLFFFFRNIVAANFSPRALIQDWLAQLLPYSPKLQFALQPRLKTSLAETSDNDLIQLFLDGVSHIPKIYCVGDALDEMTTDNRPFLDKLNGLATYRPRSLKLLITSRPKQYLQSALRDSSIVHISLQQQLVDADIISYLNHRFHVAPKSDIHRQVKQQVIDMVSRRSEGLFLYAKLTMDQVEASLQSDDLVDLSALEESLPVGLEQIYTSVLAKQREEHGVSRDLQVLVLEAVTHASRPLRLSELASLTKCVHPNATEPRGFKALTATCCGPLVEILEDETLQVIHHSFTEFLRGDSRSTPTSGSSSLGFSVIDSDKAHKRMAINCLRYLQSGPLLLEGEHSESATAEASITYHAPPQKIDPDEEYHRHTHLGLKEEKDSFIYREARLLHPFLSYAVENWSYHTSHYDSDDEEFFSAVTEFLNPSSLAFRRWLVLQWGSTSKSKGSDEGIPTPLHIAAFSGLSELALRLVQQGSSISPLDAQERIPLHWAAANGHVKAVSLLIQYGSDPNAEDGRGLKPIHLAARKNQASVVAILLKAGVEPDTIKTKENHAGRLLGGEKITKGECAILYAAQGGHTETVIAMIPFCRPKILEQLLCECCRFNRTDAVLAILDQSDVSADATFHGATALYYACGSANVKCVEALINRGADLRKTSTWAPRVSINGGRRGNGGMTTPLHHLVERWGDDNDLACRAILRMLIKAGLNLEQLDGRGNTALLLVAGAMRGSGRSSLHVPALRALLEAGADVKATDKQGDSALHLACATYRDMDAVQLLVEFGSDPSQSGAHGESTLHCAMHRMTSMTASYEYIDTVVKYLLEQGADPNAPDAYGIPAVRAGMAVGPEVFRTLLSRCEDKATKICCWFLLPNQYEIEKFVSYLEVLLAEGIDIDTRGEDGRTLYLCCVTDDDQLRVLRNLGAKPDATDNEGNDALHILCQTRTRIRSRLEKCIAEEGMDPRSTNNNGDTLLHHVASWYTCEKKDADYVRWLISLGVPVNAVNNEGCTALHVFLKTWSESEAGRIATTGRVHFIDAINDGKDVGFEIRDENGLTPLHLAAIQSGAEVATLVAAGADLGILTKDERNVLHLACRARQPNIVGLILDQPGSIDINQGDTFGTTPLHYACSSGEPESVALLLKYGANVQAKDSVGRTPLHACADFRVEQSIWDAQDLRHTWLRDSPKEPLQPGYSRQHQYDQEPWYRFQWNEPKPGNHQSFFPAVSTIVKMLLDANSDVASVDDSNLTPLEVAVQTGCAEVTEIFAADEKLFIEATKHLEDGEDTCERPEEIRQWLRARMTLMRPRSSLHSLGQDKPAFDEVLKSPSLYLDLLTCEDVAKVVNEGFEVNPLDVSYYTFLEELMKQGHLQVAERVPRLVLHYSSYLCVMDMTDRARKVVGRYLTVPSLTTLQLACGRPEPNMQMLQLLVEKLRVDVNVQYAALNGDQDSRTAEILPGGTALHLLASADNWWQVEAMRYLIAHGAAVNAQDEKGQTPMHIAACGTKYNNQVVKGSWRLNAVRVLLAHGADPNALDKQGFSPLHNASAAPDIIKELLRNGADTAIGVRSPLFQAIYDQNLIALETLLDHGVSVDSLDEVGHSRNVHYSLIESRKSAPQFRALVERGADLYLALNDNETMIHFLFEYPEYEVLDTLLQEPCVSRIDFSRRDQHGRTVLMAACNWRQVLPGYSYKHWDPKAVGPPLRILDYGADATLVDNDGKTALHHLLDNPGMPDDVLLQFVNREEVASTLLVKDNDGFSPFHYALRSFRPEVCDLMLSKGANLLEPDPNGLTALHHIAAQCLATFRSPREKGHLRVNLSEDYFGQCVALWQRFITEGGSINGTDKAGNAPLFAYLSSPDKELRNNTDVVICHLEHYDKLFPPESGVDVFAVNHEGETALHVITQRGKSYHSKGGHDKALFEAMMGKGLDPLQEDAGGRSALDSASACEKDDIVGILGRK